jgi:antigen flippase
MEDKREATSHVEALKSASIIGGSTAIVILIRMVRTKVLAILLGPAGIGLEALYGSIISPAGIGVNMGISGSGVRLIASAVGSGSQATIAATVFTLRRVCLVLGIVGAAALFLIREQVSRLTFGNADHAFDVGLLSVILLFVALTGGQGALLQGMRRIGDLAKMNILGAALGAALSIPIVYIWGLQGIPAYLVLTAAVGTLISWWYVRRIQIEAVKVPPRQVATEAASLLKLGLAFVSTGLMSTGALFLLRVFVTREAGMDGAGQFQAANAISMVYVGFVLQAMGTDFYPRLTAVADDNRRCNKPLTSKRRSRFFWPYLECSQRSPSPPGSSSSFSPVKSCVGKWQGCSCECSPGRWASSSWPRDGELSFSGQTLLHTRFTWRSDGLDFVSLAFRALEWLSSASISSIGA